MKRLILLIEEANEVCLVVTDQKTDLTFDLDYDDAEADYHLFRHTSGLGPDHDCEILVHNSLLRRTS